ncbi:hypothetical protein QUG64_12310 [Acinetobacter lwoffii]|uniref:Nucleotidyl transferase domain-containing protein n=1 Tax=Acinetobacter lwoffii NCTC 5866 = CIP 64.10 = NIPH 512 TaxID=981327 RepID=A0ABP2ZG85_ACILW|nr:MULTISPECIES: hypothetical protein [Acinetobacter]ENU15170.1 hypothetical protein F995_03083 [Acinetobacter sp. CIP A162]ESJ94574.1 hypothetical protein P800_02667 [Acinetobacter lwoffii NCTC 5866 = CIP 64.10 = NIPH 512]QXB41800.1 hypothetical protein I6L23_07285 [Acinetobacter lwoffii]SUU34136.1 Uncharacterised protein [Acinetobacter lwoffii]VFQ35540.1 Uncharacterised protein [Acinetobacter lwoffii]
MIIINSAAYVIPEFQSELGAIPPCMLPLGNQKLIQHQVKLLRKFENERIIVTLPLSYKLTLGEKSLINELDIDTVFIPDNFSLANALIYAINMFESYEKNIRILHGDTLIYDLPNQLDVISVARASTDYNWETVIHDLEKSSNLVWAGFFTFSDKNILLRSLSLSNGDFIKAIHLYGEVIVTNNLESKEWYDLGHINTYFVSRSKITTQRSFNSIKIEDGILYKSGNPSIKIIAEAHWLSDIPSRLKKYTPQIIESGRNDKDTPYYAMEYLSFLPLNEIYVHGRNSIFFWSMQFDLLNNYFKDSVLNAEELKKINIIEIEEETRRLYFDKSIKRIATYLNGIGEDFNSYGFEINEDFFLVKDIVSDCLDRTDKLPVIHSIMHGDLCFSNILYDSRSQRIKVIDPRGINSLNEMTFYGDQKYDLAKLAHSVLGMYDFIIAGRYQIKRNNKNNEVIEFELDERLRNIQRLFVDRVFIDHVSVREIMPLVVLLFLSMLPLHSDRADRQKAMLLNAIRIYKFYVLD